MRIYLPAIVLSAVCFLSSLAPGQTVTGSLVGCLSDAGDSVIAGAHVTATEVTRGSTRSTITNETGTYTIVSMEPGVYRLTVERSGFKQFQSDSVEASINSTVRVAFTSAAFGQISSASGGRQARLGLRLNF